MSDWKAFRVTQGLDVTEQQSQKLMAIYWDLASESRIAILPGSEEVGPIAVSTARTAEGERSVPVRTAGMVKFSWEDEFGVPWQGWLAADGEVVRVFSFAEADDEEDGDWVLQDGICRLMNRVGA